MHMFEHQALRSKWHSQTHECIQTNTIQEKVLAPNIVQAVYMLCTKRNTIKLLQHIPQK